MITNSLGYGNHPLFSAWFQRASPVKGGQQAFHKRLTKIDALLKSHRRLFFVIPAKAGIQVLRALAESLDPSDPVPAKAANRGDDFLRGR
jgi:hypothetical protein